MCRPVRCKRCGKTTWAGCGQHVAAVKARVPADQWCGGHTDDGAPGGGTGGGTGGAGLVRRLLRR